MKTPVLVGVAALAFAAIALAQGPGYGPGMGYGPRASLDLSDEQRTTIAALQEEHRAKNWQAMGELRAEQFKLRDMYAARADAGAIAEQQKKVDGLREQMFQRRNEMRREMDAVLAR